MAFRARPRVLAAFVVAASFAWAMGCDGDDDDCKHCCVCEYDNSPLTYRPEGGCTSCEEQCQVLADRDFMGQPFDTVKEEECD